MCEIYSIFVQICQNIRALQVKGLMFSSTLTKYQEWNWSFLLHKAGISNFLIVEQLCNRFQSNCALMIIQNGANNLKNYWSPGTWVLIWEYSARSIQWIPIWQGFDGLQKCPCALDKSRLSTLQDMATLPTVLETTQVAHCDTAVLPV